MIDVWIWIGGWAVILIICIVELWKIENRMAEDEINKMFEYLEKRKEDRELALKVLKSIPTADVVEVVRCKDCKHAIEDKLFGGLWCQHPTEKHCERNAGFYCGIGERRTDDE